MPKNENEVEEQPEDKIAYEPHPVTPERKKELRAKGFKILDARFDPKRVEKEEKKAAKKAASKDKKEGK